SAPRARRRVAWMSVPPRREGSAIPPAAAGRAGLGAQPPRSAARRRRRRGSSAALGAAAEIRRAHRSSLTVGSCRTIEAHLERTVLEPGAGGLETGERGRKRDRSLLPVDADDQLEAGLLQGDVGLV